MFANTCQTKLSTELYVAEEHRGQDHAQHGWRCATSLHKSDLLPGTCTPCSIAQHGHGPDYNLLLQQKL